MHPIRANATLNRHDGLLNMGSVIGSNLGADMGSILGSSSGMGLMRTYLALDAGAEAT